MASAARLRLVYLAYYGYVGAFMPFFPVYLRGLGFSGAELGAVQMVPSLLSLVAAPAWAAVADRHVGPARALRVATAWSAAAALLLPFATTPIAVAAAVFAISLGDRAVVPLVDSVTLEHVRRRPRDTYGRIRVFGSLGFVLLAQGLGLALTLRGDRAADRLVPAVLAALVVGYALAARRLGELPEPGPRAELRDVRALFADRRLQALVLACGLHWAACAPFHLLYGVLVRDRGLPDVVAGMGMAAGVVAEMAALAVFSRLHARVGLRPLLAAAFLGSAVRWALLARAESAVAVVGLQLLHGLTFGVFWGSATAGLSALVPPRLRATGQALFGSLVFGVANIAGYGLAGAGYDRYGSAAPLFGWAALLEAALGIAALAALRWRPRAAPVSTT
jgi:MFS transporter, PPP family, 3-phenylpropionic acid transporter